MARGEFQGAVPEPSVPHGYHFHFGNVDKKVNSTKVYDYSVLKDLERCDFKKPTSMESPVIYMTINSINISPQWNYCHCEETASYYWVTDISTLRANIWEISLQLDPLATYKDAIVKTDAYILYGQNEQDASGSALRIQDNRQNVAERPTVSRVTAEITNDAIDQYQGVYILSAVGKNNGVCTYAMDEGDVAQLLEAINQTIDDDIGRMSAKEETRKTTQDTEYIYGTMADPSTGELVTQLVSSTTNTTEKFKAAESATDQVIQYMAKNLIYGGAATECIRSCIWLPIKKNIIPQGSQEIYLGNYNTHVSGGRMSRVKNMKVETEISIPWPTDDWKRMNCQMLLYLPFCGTVGIPVDKVNNASSLKITWIVSFLDGNVSVRVNAGDYTCYVGSADISSQYAIGSSNISIMGNQSAGAIGAISAALQVGGGILSGSAGSGAAGWFSKMTGGISQNVGSSMQSMGASLLQLIPPVTQCVGTMTGNSSTLQSMEAELVLLYYPPVDDSGFQKVYGHPVMRIAKPVEGYCQTRGFSCSPEGAKPAEIAYINSAMDAGVFIE